MSWEYSCYLQGPAGWSLHEPLAEALQEAPVVQAVAPARPADVVYFENAAEAVAVIVAEAAAETAGTDL